MHSSSVFHGAGPGEEWVDRVRRRQVPENEVPGVASAPQVLARNGDAALWLGPVEVFSTGVRLSVHLLLRRSDVAPDTTAWGGMREVLFGVELRGGQRVVADDRPAAWLNDDDGPLLVHNGGGGGGRTFAYTWYLAPLPEPGDLVVVAAFPDGGLPEGRAVVAATDLAAGRAAVVVLWPWERDADVPPQRPRRPTPPDGGWFAAVLGEPPG